MPNREQAPQVRNKIKCADTWWVQEAENVLIFDSGMMHIHDLTASDGVLNMIFICFIHNLYTDRKNFSLILNTQLSFQFQNGSKTKCRIQ